MKIAHLNLDCLQAALPCMATGTDAREYLQGVLIEITETHVVYVATDGHALFAMRDKPLEPNDLIGQWIVPADIVKKAKPPSKNMSYAMLKGELGSRAGLTLAIMGGATSVFDAIDADYPNWRKVIPAKTSGEATEFFAPDVLLILWKCAKALKTSFRLSFNNDGASLVRFGYGYGDDPIDAFGLIMPKRHTLFTGPQSPPEWVSNEAEAEEQNDEEDEEDEDA